MKKAALALAALLLAHGGMASASCSFKWQCTSSGCASTMRAYSGTNSGIPDMASCEQARRKWAEMGVPPSSGCTCDGGAGAGAASGVFSPTAPLQMMQQMLAAGAQRSQESMAQGEQMSAQLGQQQTAALDDVHRQQLLQAGTQAEALRRKREELMNQLARGVANSELGAAGGSETINLRSGTNFFGQPANPTGTLTVETPGATIALPSEPPTPQGKPVDPTAAEKIQLAYENALAERTRAEELQRRLEQEKKEAERKRTEAERKYEDQQARLQAVPPEQAEKRKEEDDKLAEAEKLLKEANDLDQKASEDLEKAEHGLRDANRQLDVATQARDAAPRATAVPQEKAD